MKALRLTICAMAAIAGIATASAEEFFPTGTTWTEAWFFSGTPFDDAQVKTYEVGTDTLIGETTYKRILVDGQEKGRWIREDDGGKVWLLRDDFPQEIMLYQFDWYSDKDHAWKSNSTTIRQYIQGGELKEDIIRYEQGFTNVMEDGKNRPCISFTQSYLKAYIIRGIGQTTETAMDCCVLGSYKPEIALPAIMQCRLLTFSRDGTLVYDFKNQFKGGEFFTRGAPTAGVDIYFSSFWTKMYRQDYHRLDSISGRNVYVSAHYNKRPDDSTRNNASRLIKIGCLEAGEYKVVVSSVDDSGVMPDIVHEYPFTVEASTLPADAPRGLVHTSVAAEEQRSPWDAYTLGLIPDPYSPFIHARLEGDTLHIKGWLCFQISDHWCYYEVRGDSVYLETVERNIGPVTGGWPYYSVDLRIAPFTGNHCTIEVAHYLNDSPSLGLNHVHSTHTFDLTAASPAAPTGPRFFKANSVRLKYVYYNRHRFRDESEIWDYPGEYHHAEMWTGNDTIVDGYSCVTLWDRDEGEAPVCIGCIREDEDGRVWRYEMATRYIALDGKIRTDGLETDGRANKWAFLYDFSRSDWAPGMIIDTWTGSTSYDNTWGKIRKVETMTLLNGEEVPVADGVIYGIGYPKRLFEGNFVNVLANQNSVLLEYWRDGELLIHESPQSVDDVLMTPSSSQPMYDLTGRPVDGTQKGIFIRNGKKVLIK